MVTLRGTRIAAAIGVLAIFLAAIGPTEPRAEEPVKQGKTAKKLNQGRTKTPAPEGSAPTIASGKTAGEAVSCFGVAPTLDKVTPDEGKAGDKVTIIGTNFGQPACFRGVSFGPGYPAQFQLTNDRISTTVPRDAKKGMVLLSVTTASGENSKPFLVK